MSRVISFAGIPLGDAQARALAAPLRLPWNLVPANLARNGQPVRVPVSIGGGGARTARNRLGLADAQWDADSDVDLYYGRPECAPAGVVRSPMGRGVVQNISADFDGYIVKYRTTSGAELARFGGGRDFQVLGFEKDYAPLMTSGSAVLYVRTTDKRCGEEVLFVPGIAVLGGLVTQAEVDRAVASMAKTPEQLAIIRDRLLRQPALTKDAHERARRNGTIVDCIAQALGLPGSSAEWKCPSGFAAWFWALYATPLGKVAVWGAVGITALAVVPPLFRLATSVGSIGKGSR